MKRSSQIRLILLGGLTSAVLPACSSKPNDGLPAPSRVYANDDSSYPGKYYHAPYRAWFDFPYNFHDPKTGRYFHGGTWSAEPHRSVVNLSEPAPGSMRSHPANITRSGFGQSAGSHFFSS